MIKSLLFSLLALSVIASDPAAAATRNFAITSFDRVRVNGPYKVILATGVAPYASATGSAQALDAIALDVQGNTLVVHVGRTAWGGYAGEPAGPVVISLGTHDLAAAWLNGAGSLAIDRVKGLSFDLAVWGSGLASVESVAVDQFTIRLDGAASARLAGTALKLGAFVRGSSTLDASGLQSRDVVVEAEGPAVVKAAASGTAKVDAHGVAMVSFTGGPSCTARTNGSSVVDGCGSNR